MVRLYYDLYQIFFNKVMLDSTLTRSAFQTYDNMIVWHFKPIGYSYDSFKNLSNIIRKGLFVGFERNTKERSYSEKKPVRILMLFSPFWKNYIKAC